MQMADSRGWTERTLERRYDARLVVRQFSTIEACADAFATEVRTVHRWLEEGLSVAHADELACRLGVTPVDVWPSWFDDALSDTPDDLLNPEADHRVNRRQIAGQEEMFA